MKVVLFCGGLGLRLREFSDTVPKPMVPIGYRPIVWHLMKYYAHYGHKDFILCLGHRADFVKEYFLNYNEATTNDFVLRNGGKEVELLANDISDWTITFVDTGVHTNIGQRLMKVRHLVENEEMFLANYSDNVTDCPLDVMIEHLKRRPEKLASCISVKPSQSFHVFNSNEDGDVTEIQIVADTNIWVNGGFFIIRKGFFDYIQEGEEMVNQPFNRLICAKKLTTYKYQGFWACMDTFKEKMLLEDSLATGNAKWQVWLKNQTKTKLAA